jgi:hypothetical protein
VYSAVEKGTAAPEQPKVLLGSVLRICMRSGWLQVVVEPVVEQTTFWKRVNWLISRTVYPSTCQTEYVPESFATGMTPCACPCAPEAWDWSHAGKFAVGPTFTSSVT